MQLSVFAALGARTGQWDIDTYVQSIARFADAGFTRVWSAQLPWDADLFTAQAVALREVPAVELGSAVLPIQVAHPMLTAQRALTLNAIAGGRFKLGLGVNHPGISTQLWGIPWDKPVRRMSEYLDGLLPLLAGQKADAVGELVTTRGELDIAGAPAPEVYLAAMGPQMLRLAGRRCAGTITWMTGPKTLANHIGPTLRDAAAEAGRPEAVRVAAGIPLCVTDDVAGARARAAEQFRLYGTLPSYRAMLDREGYASPEDAVVIGDEGTVSDRIEELRSAGVDELIASPFGDDEESIARSVALLKAVAGV
ncbi:TIGR03564 family F420-dependent LLM class oxidoreductase [Mycobacterium sherrisii]|uniref:TIGR03564 family F420-dependent LLM class oxidoreductase n=1 Tax=Mycobacterium sherrisii TaxID=243061 RepID=UPI002DDCF5E8|nr:TIGR03564 family F420-dependent LLM class oxidoreductase [Mycobacterium sherrisii]MEC4763996.1 TIGR03564 family F420-dependent LLM class oxidoreductase [Mycobacterium sherrisii]